MRYSCIYRISNSVNDKVYIGSAADFDTRVFAHISKLNSHTHPNCHLQAAWDKYGAESFVFACIEECHKENLIAREQYWIDFYDAANPEHGYNIAQFAGNTLGRKCSEETKAKIREKAIGRKSTQEVRHKMSLSHIGDKNWMYGRSHKDVSKQKMRLIGGKIDKSIAYSGCGNPFYGKTHTEQTKSIISAKQRGKRSRAKLGMNDVVEIKSKLKSKPDKMRLNDYFLEISKQYGVSISCIRKIYSGERWREL